MHPLLKRIAHPSPRGKLRWTVALVTALFLISLVYTSSQAYNASRETMQRTVRTVPFLSGVSFPELTFPAWPPAAFQLGLDLQGGTHLVYLLDLTKIPDADRSNAVAGVRDVIERRVNLLGVSEPIVQTVKVGDSHRLIVELAGVHDVNQAIRMIGDTPILEFKEEKTEEEKKVAEVLTPEQQKEIDDYNTATKKRAEEVLKSVVESQSDFATLAKEFSDDSQSKDKGGDLGWVSTHHFFSSFIEFVKNVKPGEAAQTVIDQPDSYNILKLLDKRSSEKEVKARHLLICYKGASRCEKDTSKEDARKQIQELKKTATSTNFTDLAKQHSTEPGAKERGGDLGWFKRGMMVKPFEDVAFTLANNTVSDTVETDFGFHLILKEDERTLTEYRIARIAFAKRQDTQLTQEQNTWKETGLSGKHLKRASVEFSQTTQFPEVLLEFNDEGKKLFGDITTRNVGKQVAIFLDGQPISTPRVNQAITDGNAVIQGDFTVADAKQLSQRLNTGALPVPVFLVSQQTVGASLGIESLEKSLKAGLIGFLLVALFMIVVYRLPGVLAVCALIIYTTLALALFKSFPITLTLAGIAGFILSIGMAVDANVLIFERMKEELGWGKALDTSIKDGFKRAWTSIRDSNISSLITCVVLFWFSASLIKGFALTLALGILLSMFSAIVITRIGLRFVAGWKWAQAPWLFRGSKKKEE